MLKIKHHILYKKDFKKLVKNGFDDSVLNEVILGKKEPLDPQFQDHALKGKWKPFRECHLQPDLLLVYQIKKQENTLFLVRLGSHSELF
ncbi:type II toxin-antitoxin system YafQ family toxin [Helicobacter pylori]|uniref:type II toxin-antitoxin system RelE/ParE family toxin n=1 Tax=Helicobacter pylori TaxID=210 RepID=UPI000BEA4288|nr:type II toxin-antitoxin system YafQ family toxin [Helicobacter pylori]PDW67971.1 addiction module toxin RelE [Helicobacter pylori]